MRLINYICILSLTLIMLSCKKSDSEIIRSSKVIFPRVAELSYKTLPTDFLLAFPMCILLTDSHLIIQDEYGHDFFFHAINRTSGELDYEFGGKGNGPGEMTFITWSSFYDKLKNEIQSYDSNSKRLCLFNQNEHTANSTNFVDISVKYNLFVQNLIDLDTCYLSTGMNGDFNKHRFVVFDKSLELTGKSGHYPVLDAHEGTNKELLNYVFKIPFWRVSPNKKHLLFASHDIGLMEIFELDSLPKVNTVKSLLLTEPMKNDRENIIGFEDVHVTDNFIYALHNGKTAAENSGSSKSIKVFDWEGNPVIEYNVGIDMRCLAVDEEKNIIYAVAYDEDNGFFLIQMDVNCR